MVIDFTATWCGPCKAMLPAIDDYATIYADVEFVKIDVDKLEVMFLFGPVFHLTMLCMSMYDV